MDKFFPRKPRLSPGLSSLETFHQQLRQHGSYDTPRSSGESMVCYRFPRWYFHMGIQRVVLKGAAEARRGQFDRRAWGTLGFAVQQLAEDIGGSVSYCGFSAASRTKGPVVWVANHMSALETFTLPSALLAFGDVCVVLKRSLTRYPFFGRAVKATQPIAISRSDPRQDLLQVMREGTAWLKRGRSVILFPQSTRMIEFRANRFNSIGVKLARHAGVPVVPVALTTDFAMPGRWLREFGPVFPERRIRFAASEPIGPGLPPRQWHKDVFGAIAGKLEAWGYPVSS